MTRCSRRARPRGSSPGCCGFPTGRRSAPPPRPGSSGLSDREREVLTLVARGLNNAETGEALGLSPLTAKTHVSRIMGKLGARDRAQLVITAYESGLVAPGAGRLSPGERARGTAASGRSGPDGPPAAGQGRGARRSGGGAGTGTVGENGPMSLFRDDGIVLRTQKLGEADRIITLLTRRHGTGAGGGPRGAADQVEVRRAARTVQPRRRAVLRARQRAGRPRAAAVHAGRDHRAVRRRHRHRLRPLHRGHRDAGDGGTVHRPRGRAGRAAVPAAGRRAAHARRGRPRPRGSSSTPSCCARWPSTATRPASTTARSAAWPVRTGSSRSARAESSAATAGCPEASYPLGSHWNCSARCCGGDWETADACEPRHCREGSGLVAAYLQWHLERGLRSLRFVEK